MNYYFEVCDKYGLKYGGCMKKILVLLVLMFLACSVKQQEPITATTLTEALQLSKEFNRPVLIDFMTDW